MSLLNLHELSYSQGGAEGQRPTTWMLSQVYDFMSGSHHDMSLVPSFQSSKLYLRQSRVVLGLCPLWPLLVAMCESYDTPQHRVIGSVVEQFMCMSVCVLTSIADV